MQNRRLIFISTTISFVLVSLLSFTSSAQFVTGSGAQNSAPPDSPTTKSPDKHLYRSGYLLSGLAIPIGQFSDTSEAETFGGRIGFGFSIGKLILIKPLEKVLPKFLGLGVDISGNVKPVLLDGNDASHDYYGGGFGAMIDITMRLGVGAGFNVHPKISFDIFFDIDFGVSFAHIYWDNEDSFAIDAHSIFHGHTKVFGVRSRLSRFIFVLEFELGKREYEISPYDDNYDYDSVTSDMSVSTLNLLIGLNF